MSKFFRIDRKQIRCPRCGKEMRPPVSIRGTSCQYWLRCTDVNCKTFIDTMVPMAHQANILRDPSKRVGVFGAYGSGKTVTCFKGDEKHAMITPNGETLIGAATLVQLDNTVRKDLEGDFPVEFIRSYNRQKNMFTLVNGHIIYYRPLESAGDLRSYNLSRVHVLESSEVDFDLIAELHARVRNNNGMIFDTDENGDYILEYSEEYGQMVPRTKYNWIQTYYESNPDSGWIRSNVLMRSGKIHIYGGVDTDYTLDPTKVLPFMSTHIIPTRANYYLPAGYIDELSRDKPWWWVRRYVEGDFNYAEGAVYPNAMRAVIDDFEIPNDWPRIIGYDYGLNDNSHFLFGAIDFEGVHSGKPAVYWYAEIQKNNANIEELVRLYKQELRNSVPQGSLYRTPVMDAKSYGQRTKTGAMKTVGRLFLDLGCFFKAAEMNMDARILKTNVLIDSGQEYFFKNGVPGLINELKDYKYPDRTLGKTGRADDKPIDKNNHGISALEFANMELPKGLKEPDGRVARPGNALRDLYDNPKKPKWDPFAEEEKDDYEGFGGVFHY